MAKKIKRGTKGQTTNFISRVKAIKRLDMSLKDFRKLCILKGIFPREPGKTPSNNHKTYYHVKDISFLANDKLISFFRQQKTYRKKLQRAIARHDKTRVKMLKENKPALDINHIVRERYPNFADALKDMEDPLTSLSLMAKFPAHRLFKVAPEKIELSKILILMLKAFVVNEKLLRKVFLSVKGVYYQIEISGQKITWLEPYSFVTTLPFDVDYKIILSFTEFYQVLTKFVLFKLYNDRGLSFPPTILTWEDNETSLSSETVTFQNVRVEKSSSNTEEQPQIDEEFQNDRQLKQILQHSGKVSKDLFKGLVFFLSREVQKDLFELCIRSFSGSVIYDGENFEANAYSENLITHVVTDRNPEQIKQIANREYVQPQWICDSINFGMLLPVSDYRPGKPLPPHLSPFVDDEKEGFVPERKKEIMRLQGEYIEESVNESAEENSEKDKGGEKAKLSSEENINKNADKKKNDKKAKKYEVKEEFFDIEKEDNNLKRKTKKSEKKKEALQAMMLTSKKQRLLNKIQNLDEKKKEKVNKILERKKQIKTEKLKK